jgi:hypothetical protein
MKKTSIYFIFPIVALVLFGGYYWNFRSTYEAHQAEIAKAAKEKIAAKLLKDEEERDKAIQDAVEAQKARKAERQAREALDRKQKDDKENARLNADKAEQESQRLQREVEKLTKDVASEKDDIAKIEADDAKQVAEQAFLADYVKKAEDNRADLAMVLTKIQAADEAEARAKALAAAEAKKKEE